MLEQLIQANENSPCRIHSVELCVSVWTTPKHDETCSHSQMPESGLPASQMQDRALNLKLAHLMPKPKAPKGLTSYAGCRLLVRSRIQQGGQIRPMSQHRNLPVKAPYSILAIWLGRSAGVCNHLAKETSAVKCLSRPWLVDNLLRPWHTLRRPRSTTSVLLLPAATCLL